jgi:hypothetical protein
LRNELSAGHFLTNVRFLTIVRLKSGGLLPKQGDPLSTGAGHGL